MARPNKIRPEELLEAIPTDKWVGVNKILKLFPKIKNYHTARRYLEILKEKGLVEEMVIDQDINTKFYFYRGKK